MNSVSRVQAPRTSPSVDNEDFPVHDVTGQGRAFPPSLTLEQPEFGRFSDVTDVFHLGTGAGRHERGFSD